jgi:seryl-tRNA synthetase
MPTPTTPRRASFPPLIPRATFEAVGYLRNFPQLCGPVFSFEGGRHEHEELVSRLDADQPYDDCLTQSELALTPACCYPVYPSLAGTLPDAGELVDTQGWCFRHEPSVDPMRLQTFRMIEHIRVAAPDAVLEWREHWLQQAPKVLGALGLDVHADVANDPFFGRAGRLMAVSQRELQLKMEMLVPVFGTDHPTACASINYHQDHFGHLFGIRTNDGNDAHSSCVGFGLERCVVAMFAAHGMDVGGWPTSVLEALGR